MRYSSTIIALNKLIAKPIKVDTHRIRELAKELNSVLQRAIPDSASPMDNRVLVRGAPFDITDVNGKEKTVYIRVLSEPAASKDYVLSGGYGSTDAGHKVVVVNINGSIPAKWMRDVAKNTDILTDGLYLILVHELVHAADWEGISKRPTTNYIPDTAEMDLSSYFNDPAEVRAYTSQLIHELDLKRKDWYKKLNKHFKSYEALKLLVKTTDTWQQIEPYITDKTRNKILKDVWSHVTSLNTQE